MTKTRIILITSKLNFLTAGGSVHDLDMKSEELVRRGYDARIMTAYSQSNKFGDRKPTYGVIEERFDSQTLWALQRSTADAMKRHENDTDVFYVEGQFGFGAGIYKLRGGKRPVICFCNVEVSSWLDLPDPTPSFKRRITRVLRRGYENTVGAWLMNQLDYFIFTAPTVKAKFASLNVRGEPHVILPDFVDAEGLRRRAGAYRESLQRTAENKPVLRILCSGRMIAEKGFDLVVKAVAELKNKDRIEVIMCGGGPEQESLIALAKQLGVDQRISFAGWVERDALLAEMVKADVFILPRWRPHLTSVVLLEAMGFGLPSIVPGGGGPAWLAGDAALNFEFENAKSLAEQLERLTNDPELRASLSRHALARMDEFSPEHMGGEMARIIDELAAHKA